MLPGLLPGDVPEAAVLEELGVSAAAAELDVLEGLSNEEALQARQVVSALKLSKQELAEHILPEVGWRGKGRGAEGEGGTEDGKTGPRARPKGGGQL